jgi:(2Fe-2S) ferredoxin
MARPEKHVFVCTQSRPPGHPRGSCAEKAGGDIMGEFGQQFEQRGLWGRFLLTSAGCMGGCDSGLVVLIYPEGVMYGNVSKEDVSAIIDEHLLGDKQVERLKVAPEVW